jgi:hypothetical protein
MALNGLIQKRGVTGGAVFTAGNVRLTALLGLISHFGIDYINRPKVNFKLRKEN